MKSKGLPMIVSALLAACAGSAQIHENLNPPAAPEPRHQRYFAEDAERACAASRYVLLGEGYVVERHGEEGYVGVREFPVKQADEVTNKREKSDPFSLQAETRDALAHPAHR